MHKKYASISVPITVGHKPRTISTSVHYVLGMFKIEYAHAQIYTYAYIYIYIICIYMYVYIYIYKYVDIHI